VAHVYEQNGTWLNHLEQYDVSSPGSSN